MEKRIALPFRKENIACKNKEIPAQAARNKAFRNVL